MAGVRYPNDMLHIGRKLPIKILKETSNSESGAGMVVIPLVATLAAATF